MADRQIFQLTTRILTLNDVLPSQDDAGAVEAGKSTFMHLKDLMQTGARRLVIKINYNGAFVYTVMENDHTPYGVSILSVTSPANGIVNIKVSVGVFAAIKTDIILSSMNVAGVPYFVNGIVSASDTISLGIYKHDGTQTNTPFFTDYFVKIVTYL